MKSVVLLKAWLATVGSRGRTGRLPHKATFRDNSRMHDRSMNRIRVRLGGNERPSTAANYRKRPFVESMYYQSFLRFNKRKRLRVIARST